MPRSGAWNGFMRVMYRSAAYPERSGRTDKSGDLKVALEAGEHVIVVDARSLEAYRREHIPGAVNLPHRMAP